MPPSNETTLQKNELTEPQRALLLAMYDSLRKEIDDFLKEISVLIWSALMASFAAWAWLLTTNAVVHKNLYYVLPALVAVGGLRAHSLRQGTVRAAQHLGRIERAFGLQRNLGWHLQLQPDLTVTRTFRSFEAFKRSVTENPLALWLYFYWLCLFGINFGFAYYLSAIKP